MKILIASLALMLLTVGLSVSADSDQQELTTLLHEFMDGASRNDAAAHDRFWAEELIYTSSSGERFGKAEIMSGFEDETEQEEDQPETIYTAEDVNIRLYGSTAVVTFRLMGVEQTEPAAVTEYFNTGTFVKQGDQWRAVAWQATKITPAS